MISPRRPRAPAVRPRAVLVGPLPVDPAASLLMEQAVLPPVAPMDLLLAKLARGLRVALAAPLPVVEPVGPPRRAPVAKPLRRRRF